MQDTLTNSIQLASHFAALIGSFSSRLPSGITTSRTIELLTITLIKQHAVQTPCPRP
jgi:hypothetical protein